MATSDDCTRSKCPELFLKNLETWHAELPKSKRTFWDLKDKISNNYRHKNEKSQIQNREFLSVIFLLENWET